MSPTKYELHEMHELYENDRNRVGRSDNMKVQGERVIDISKLTGAELQTLAHSVADELGRRLAVADALKSPGVPRAADNAVAVAARPNMSIVEVARALAVSVPTIRRRMNDRNANFPKPVNHKHRGALRWRASDIRALAMLVDARDVEQILCKLNEADNDQPASRPDALLHGCSTEVGAESKSL
jgi:predicted DNA-binding transcriptional regulator AlpA